jgi:hypothetical protein
MFPALFSQHQRPIWTSMRDLTTFQGLPLRTRSHPVNLNTLQGTAPNLKLK